MRENRSRCLRNGLGFLLVFALAKLLLHLVVNAGGGYGIFRDELYYLACADYPAFGYVDQPPLSIWILAAGRALLGSSVFALRFWPALAGAAAVFLAGLLTRELGGRRFAQGAAMAATIVSLIHLAFSDIYSMNAFDLAAWALAALLIVRLIKTGNPRIWLWLGLVLGLGLLNKISVLWLGAGIAAGLVLTGERKWLRTRWPWLGGALAFALFLPYLVWNHVHDWPHLEFMRNAVSGKYAGLTFKDFVEGQILLPNPMTLFLWVPGLFFLLFHPRGKRFRWLGIIFAVVFLILAANRHSKAEYLAAAFVPVFAGGGVFLEILTAGKLSRLRPAAAAVLASGLLLAPVALPILPVETYIRYTAFLGIRPQTSEAKQLAELPQHYADRFGWENMAAAVSKVYLSLPPEERTHTVVLGRNYGEAGAIDYFRGRYDLPPAVAMHNNYWLWGYPEDIRTVIIIGGREEDHRRALREVEPAAVIRSPYAMPYENNLTVFVGRGLKIPLEEIWGREKNFD